MDGLIKAIRNARETEKKVEYYFTMPVDEKCELLADLAKEKNEDIGVFLNAIYPDEPDKNIRKEIRRVIFRLRSSGIKVDEPKKEGASALHKVEEIRDNRGYLTNFDYAGSRMVMAAYEIKKNTFVFLNGELHFKEGLRELMSTPLDRKNLDVLFQAYRDNTVEPACMAEISPSYAAYIVEEGSKMSGRFTDAVSSLKSFAAHIRDSVSRPEDIYSLPTETDAVSPGIGDIMGHSIFTPFALTWETIHEDRKNYASQEASGIVLPRHMVEEKREGLIEDIMKYDAVRSQVPRLKRMLEDYAYLLYGMGDQGSYRGIISALRSDEGITRTVVHFIKKGLEVSEDKKTGQTDLIVNPYG